MVKAFYIRYKAISSKRASLLVFGLEDERRCGDGGVWVGWEERERERGIGIGIAIGIGIGIGIGRDREAGEGKRRREGGGRRVLLCAAVGTPHDVLAVGGEHGEGVEEAGVGDLGQAGACS